MADHPSDSILEWTPDGSSSPLREECRKTCSDLWGPIRGAQLSWVWRPLLQSRRFHSGCTRHLIDADRARRHKRFNVFPWLYISFITESSVKNLPAMWEPREMQVRSLHQEDPLEEEMATHSSILAWRSPWTEEPGSRQSLGSQRVRRDLVSQQLSTHHECLNALPWLCISFITNLSTSIEQLIKQPNTIYEVFWLPSLQKDKWTNQKFELNLLAHELTGYTASTEWGPSTD